MKKFILFIASMLCAFGAFAQEEPEFVGEVNLVKSDGSVVKLDKEFVTITTKANATVYLFGAGKVKQKINIPGPAASTRTMSSEPIKLIVKAVDNEADPMAIINVFPLIVTKKTRVSEIATMGTFSGASSGQKDRIKFTAKKFGEKSYEVILNNPPKGEIGIIVSNPNAKDERSIVVSCMGID